VTEEEIRVLFGSRIKSKRQAKEITQQDLADAIGVSRATLTGIESGKQNTSIVVAYKITKILKMKIFE
jgi:putative transcriptional regulator